MTRGIPRSAPSPVARNRAAISPESQAARLIALALLVLVVLVGTVAAGGCTGADGPTAATATTAAGPDATPAGTQETAASNVAPTGSATSSAGVDTSQTPGTPGSASTDPSATGAGGTAPGDTGATTDTTFEPALTYSNADYGLEFSYPADWRLTDDIISEGEAGGSARGGVGVFDPRGTQRNGVLLDGIVISVYDLGVTIDEALLPVFRSEVESVLPELQAQLTDALVIEPLTPTSVNGVPGFETTYTFTQDGRELRTRMLFLVAGSTEYQLTVQGSAAEWDSLRPSFDVVLGTFRARG